MNIDLKTIATFIAVFISLAGIVGTAYVMQAEIERHSELLSTEAIQEWAIVKEQVKDNDRRIGILFRLVREEGEE